MGTKLQRLKENLIVVGIFTGILLPLRLVFYHYLSHYWIGSFGLLSIVLFSLFYLSYKGKLGKLGNLILRYIQRRSKGKLAKFGIASTSFGVYFSLLIIIGSTYGNVQDVATGEKQLSQNHIVNIKTLMSTPMPNYNAFELFQAFIILLTPNQINFVVIKIANDLSNGWVLTFFTIALAEDLEILGLLLYFRYKKMKIVE